MSDAAATKTDVLPALRETPPRLIEQPKRRSKARRLVGWLLSPESRAVVYLGLAVIVAGFAVIAFTWSKVAATLAVPIQVPYIASGGFVGLGLVVVGAVIVSVGVKRRDNFARLRRLEKLTATMESIERRISEPPEGDKERRET